VIFSTVVDEKLNEEQGGNSARYHAITALKGPVLQRIAEGVVLKSGIGGEITNLNAPIETGITTLDA